MAKKYVKFLNRWAANAERLHRIGIHPFGFDPGYLCSVDGEYRSLDISENTAKIICGLIKKSYPETENDETMIEAYRKRIEEKRGLQGDG